jgi:glycosyltransferase involved in cell wall biosynthesis
VQEIGIEKKVIFFGRYHLDELLTVYQYIDIAFFTSLADTLSTVAIEQAVAGLPFVVVDDPGVTEIAQPGVNAIAVENDAGKLAYALKKLIDDKRMREKYGKESVKIGNEFTIKAFGDRIERMYEEQIEKNEKNKKNS